MQLRPVIFRGVYFVASLNTSKTTNYASVGEMCSR